MLCYASKLKPATTWLLDLHWRYSVLSQCVLYNRAGNPPSQMRRGISPSGGGTLHAYNKVGMDLDQGTWVLVRCTNKGDLGGYARKVLVQQGTVYKHCVSCVMLLRTHGADCITITILRIREGADLLPRLTKL